MEEKANQKNGYELSNKKKKNLYENYLQEKIFWPHLIACTNDNLETIFFIIEESKRKKNEG